MCQHRIHRQLELRTSSISSESFRWSIQEYPRFSHKYATPTVKQASRFQIRHPRRTRLLYGACSFKYFSCRSHRPYHFPSHSLLSVPCPVNMSEPLPMAAAPPEGLLQLHFPAIFAGWHESIAYHEPDQRSRVPGKSKWGSMPRVKTISAEKRS